MYAFIPMYLVVPIAYWLAFRSLGFPMHWASFGLGALGWWVAYLLRIPTSLALKKWASATLQTRIVYFSGPFEEGVRVALLLLTAASLRVALSVGQGWAAIEVVFAVVNGIALTSLQYRSDAKALEAKRMLETTGLRLDASPWWGVWERLSASAFHIGSTLIIAWSPWTVFAMIPIHTALNVIAMRFMKKSLIQTESFLFGLGFVVLGVGLMVEHMW